ncbi:MAG TPA: hypothetical protein VHL11_06825 [Phototrophicaceae bacterium]|nr:hypothetical protein [Phototrophicaceae bacterium]
MAKQQLPRFIGMILFLVIIYSVINVPSALPEGLSEVAESTLNNSSWHPNPFNGRVFSEEQKLTASDGAQGDDFAWSVALDGDTALVGAITHNTGAGDDEGAVYVFVYDGVTWTEQAQLLASDGADNDGFGVSVALDGDTALIGADNHNIGVKADQGAAYVFTRSGTTWTEQAKLTASDGAASDHFGISVALNGDSALVGSYNDDVGANANQGSAYVFTRSGTNWTEQTKLTASDGAVEDWFGASVAIDADTALVGAQFDDSQQGSAYVFTRSGVTWSQQTKLTADDGAPDDNFGISTALDGDTALIGAAYNEVDTNATQGSAYVFTRSGVVWSEEAQLVGDDSSAGDGFGVSVSLDGEAALVGAWYDDITSSEQGSAYHFTRSGGIWTQQNHLIASDPDTFDNFGHAVALSGDTALVGAFGDDIDSNSQQGSAYVFVDDGLEATPTPEPTDVPPVELLINGGFELKASGGGPDLTPWIVKNQSSDKIKCNKDTDGDGNPDKIFAHTGDCGFRFKGSSTEDSSLIQLVPHSAFVALVAGDTLAFSAYTLGGNNPVVRVKVQVKYTDALKDKLIVDVVSSPAYILIDGNIELASSNVRQVKVQFTNQSLSGKTLIDDVSLLHITGSALIELPGAQLSPRQ